MTPPTARAVRFDRHGDRDVLYVADVPRPSPGPDEVLVEVRAAGINPGETNIRTGALRDRFPTTFPSGQGSDLAGSLYVVACTAYAAVRAVAARSDETVAVSAGGGWSRQHCRATARRARRSQHHGDCLTG